MLAVIDMSLIEALARVIGIAGLCYATTDLFYRVATAGP